MTRTFIPVCAVLGDVPDEAAELPRRAVVLAADRPPEAACAAVSAVGTPSTNSRTVRGSGGVPSCASPVPTMSLLNMPWTSAPASLNACAMWSEPYRPCSSPATAAKTMVASVRRVAITRASSSTAATPDASSSAPGRVARWRP